MKYLITGATNGMGKGVAKALASADNHAHEIIILCRSKALGESLIKEFAASTLNNNISIVIADLTKLSDVKRAVEEIHRKHNVLDGVFINAGLGYAAERIETEDGLDSHFQVNYLSQFMLTLNILDLLEKSENGGRVIFNATAGGEIFWDDMQMKQKWGYENGIRQAMVAKRMLLATLHRLFQEKKGTKLSFIGYNIPKTVWTNQLTIIPAFMRFMATIMKYLGTFISIEEAGEMIAPLFTETQQESLKKSGQLMTTKNGEFTKIVESSEVTNPDIQDKLWEISVALCNDEETSKIAASLIT